jgi:hypothetical protein
VRINDRHFGAFDDRYRVDRDVDRHNRIHHHPPSNDRFTSAQEIQIVRRERQITDCEITGCIDLRAFDRRFSGYFFDLDRKLVGVFWICEYDVTLNGTDRVLRSGG